LGGDRWFIENQMALLDMTVAIYLPMIPEAFFSIFACSKIGAIHTTIFCGFSGKGLHARLGNSAAKMLIT